MTPLPKPPLAIPHLSASSVSDYLRCPLGWYGTRIACWPQSPVFAMEAGVAIHKALTAYHRGEDAELAILAAWKEIKAERPTGALERMIATLGLYSRRFTPKEIDVADYWFKVEIPDVPVPFIGAYDLVRVTNQRPTEGIVVDWKSGNPRWKQGRADSELQATAYWFAYQQETSYTPDRFVYVLMTTNAGTPTLTTLTTRRTQEDLDTFVSLVQDVYLRIMTEPPAPMCRAGWCRFPEQCAKYRGEE